MASNVHTRLSRRESQIMDALYQLGEGGVREVLEQMEDPPNYNSIRVILGILEKKGFVSHFRDGKRFIYRPVEAGPQAARAATRYLLKTFYGDSTPRAVATLIDVAQDEISDDELDALSELIESARRQRK